MAASQACFNRLEKKLQPASKKALTMKISYNRRRRKASNIEKKLQPAPRKASTVVKKSFDRNGKKLHPVWKKASTGVKKSFHGETSKTGADGNLREDGESCNDSYKRLWKKLQLT